MKTTLLVPERVHFVLGQKEESLHPNAREMKECKFTLEEEYVEIRITSSLIAFRKDFCISDKDQEHPFLPVAMLTS